MSASAELVPMGTITAQLGQRIDVGEGAQGHPTAGGCHQR